MSLILLVRIHFVDFDFSSVHQNVLHVFPYAKGLTVTQTAHLDKYEDPVEKSDKPYHGSDHRVDTQKLAKPLGDPVFDIVLNDILVVQLQNVLQFLFLHIFGFRKHHGDMLQFLSVLSWQLFLLVNLLN